MHLALVAGTLLAAHYACAVSYVRSEYYKGHSFFENFEFWNEQDPTGGFVQYVAEDEARALGMISSTLTKARIGVENKLIAGNEGRKSVRLQSKKKFTDSLFVLELSHMPTGRGTWPAYWTVGDNWPLGGEIDIIEGANDQGPNESTLHTGPGCTIQSFPSGNLQTGNTLRDNCDAHATSNNLGCSVGYSSSGTGASSFGPELNAAGGGWYVMQRSASAIRIWWFPRNGKHTPVALKTGSPIIPSQLDFGTPQAQFTPALCNYGASFGPHRIILNTDLCGDWGAGTYAQAYAAKGGGTCEDFVRFNPLAYSDAFWEIDSISVYFPTGL